MPRAVVVGAGVAGIAAAISLVRRGWGVIVLEARPSVGGRAGAVWDPTAGEFVDCGQHVVIGAYRALFEVLQTLGTRDLLGSGNPLSFLFCDGSGSFLFEAGRLPGRFGFLAALWRIPGLSKGDRWRLFWALWRLLSTEVPEMTVADFCRRSSQGQRAVQAFWQPLTLATLNAPPEEAALSLLRTVLREGFLRNAETARFFVPQQTLGCLLQPFGDWLSRHGGTLLLNTAVSGLEIERGAVRAVRTVRGERIPADAVILALPPWSLVRVVPAVREVPEYAAFLKALRYSTIVTLYLWLREPVMSVPVYAFAHPDLHWAFRRPTRCGAESVALVVSAAEHLRGLPRRTVVQRLVESFAAMVPSFALENALHWRLMVESRATVRLTPEVVRLRPSGKTPWRGLVLAGDWLQTGLPCTLEAAARSGEAAAAAVESD